MTEPIEYIGGTSWGAFSPNPGCIDIRVKINHPDPVAVELQIIELIRKLSGELNGRT
jgi:hypothetical protein